jgi:hypothetical protein
VTLVRISIGEKIKASRKDEKLATSLPGHLASVSYFGTHFAQRLLQKATTDR